MAQESRGKRSKRKPVKPAAEPVMEEYQPADGKRPRGKLRWRWLFNTLAATFVVVAIAVVAVVIASNPNSGTIMGLVENAWGLFGAAFGPTIMLSLFWKRFNFAGALAGIVAGALTDVLWLAFLGSTGIYEIIPGCIVGLIAAVLVTKLTPAPDKAVEALFDRACAN